MSTSKNKLSVQTLVRCAMIAAVYTVLCLVLQPFSYGAVQVRVAEAFLPAAGALGAEYIVGVTLGCLLANLLGSTMVDVVFGTAATLIAASGLCAAIVSLVLRPPDCPAASALRTLPGRRLQPISGPLPGACPSS